VRTTNILSTNNKRHQVGILFYELLDLIHIQLALFEKGILIRGSVVINEVFHRNPYIFGPGLNQAYKIENEKAIYPRIVVSEEIFELVKSSPLLKARHHTFSEESEYVQGLVRKYRDKNYFLDYLSVAESEVNEPPNDYIKYLKLHKSKIQFGLNKYSKNQNVLEKYKWLKKYHNNTVAQLRGKVLNKYGAFKKELFI
jgi:disulfide oxidoreductase YuzD